MNLYKYIKEILNIHLCEEHFVAKMVVKNGVFAGFVAYDFERGKPRTKGGCSRT